MTDNGRGMPVDMHPEQGKPGVEVILTRCTPAVNSRTRTTSSAAACTAWACRWSTRCPRLEVKIRRDGRTRMTFADGDKKTDLEVVDAASPIPAPRCAFRPMRYFDTPSFLVSRLRHLLRAKAVLCPGLRVSFTDDKGTDKWLYETA